MESNAPSFYKQSSLYRLPPSPLPHNSKASNLPDIESAMESQELQQFLF